MSTNSSPDAIAVRTRVGGRLRKLRQEHGLKQREAAEIAGLSAQSIREYEKAITAPSLLPVLWLCRRYGISLDELVS